MSLTHGLQGVSFVQRHDDLHGDHVADGIPSCNCPGWATSKKTPKSCKHSRQVHGEQYETLGEQVVVDSFDFATATFGRVVRGSRYTPEKRVEAPPKKKRKIIL